MNNLTKIERFLKKAIKPKDPLFEANEGGVYRVYCTNGIDGLLELKTKKDTTFQTRNIVEAKALDNLDDLIDKFKGLYWEETNLLEHLSTLKKASGFVGKDELRPVMKGIYVNSNMIAATDAHVLYKANCATSLNDEGVILDPRILMLFEIANKIELCNSNGDELIRITGEGFTFTCNLINGKYPKIDAVIPDLSLYSYNIELSTKVIADATKECKKVNKHQAVFCLGEKNRFEFKQNNDGPEVSKFIEVEVKEGNNINPDEVIIMMPCRGDVLKPKFDLYQLDKIKKAVKADSYIVNWYDVNKAFIVNCVSTSKPKTKNKTSSNTKNNNNMDLIKQIELLKAEIEKMKKEISNPEHEAKQETKQVPETEANQKPEAKQETKQVTEAEVKQETKQVPGPEAKTIDVQIIDYSKKAIVLKGEGTKEIKDRIKNELFGKFNKFLKDSDGNKYAGWVVSSKRKTEALELIK